VSDSIVVAGKSLGDLDAHCATGAPPGRYVAWYSSDAVSASARLGTKHGWVRPDGKPFANTLGELLAGKIYYPLRLDRMGNDVAGTNVTVATATLPNGAWSGNTCLGAGAGPLDVGVADGTTGAWTQHGSSGCSLSTRVYCLQVDHANDIVPPAAVGRLAFVTKGTVDATMGLQRLDNLCSTEAGVPARALVATQTGSAKARLPLGTQIVRADGAVVFDEAATTQLTPINVTADGTMYRDVNVWAGALRFDAVGMTETCNDWFDNTDTLLGRTGRAARSLNESFGGVTIVGCGGNMPVYCAVL
jgi:hypothetical protein